MYIKTLVGQDIEEGRKVVEALRKLMPITAAFWTNGEEGTKWKLMIITPFVPQNGPLEGRHLLQQALEESKAALDGSDITLSSPVRLEYKRLRSRSGDTPEDTRSFPPWREYPGDSYVYIMN